MKQNEKYKLSEKFWEGETSLPEEKAFLDFSIHNPEIPTDELYAKYVFEKRSQGTGLEEQAWKQISGKNRFRKRILYTASVAASFIILIASIALINGTRNGNNREADFALLEQTLKHVSEGIDPENKPAVEILYEDEMIVIVSEDSN